MLNNYVSSGKFDDSWSKEDTSGTSTTLLSVFVNKYMKVPGVSYLKVSFILISAIRCRNVLYNNEVKSNKHLVIVV